MKKFVLLILSKSIEEDMIFDKIVSEIGLTNPLIYLEISADYQYEYILLDQCGKRSTRVENGKMMSN